MTGAPPPLLAPALDADAAGICVIPIKQDGSKAPDLAGWTVYQQRRPTRQQLEAWFGNGRTGYAAIGGAISGNLAIIDFDEAATFDDFTELAHATGLGGLWERALLGY